MTPTEQDLAQQLAQHERWEWRPGMGVHVVSSAHEQQPDRLVVADERHWHAAGAGEGRPIWIRYRLDQMRRKHIPDLAEPATQGCLIAMLTDRLLTIGHRREEDDGGELWRIVIVADDGRMQGFRGTTLGEALARALLAADEVVA